MIFILPLKFLCLKRLILLAEVSSSDEKILRLWHYPTGDIILAQGLGFRTAHDNRAFGWGSDGRKLLNLVKSYRPSSSKNFLRLLVLICRQFKARWVLEFLAKICPTRNSPEAFLEASRLKYRENLGCLSFGVPAQGFCQSRWRPWQFLGLGWRLSFQNCEYAECGFGATTRLFQTDCGEYFCW